MQNTDIPLIEDRESQDYYHQNRQGQTFIAIV
jgi:hypothetical protein